MNKANTFNAKEFERVFKDFDRDGSGTIEKDEMVHFMKKVLGDDGFNNLSGLGAIVGQNMLKTYEAQLAEFTKIYDQNYDKLHSEAVNLP